MFKRKLSPVFIICYIIAQVKNVDKTSDHIYTFQWEVCKVLGYVNIKIKIYFSAQGTKNKYCSISSREVYEILGYVNIKIKIYFSVQETNNTIPYQVFALPTNCPNS